MSPEVAGVIKQTLMGENPAVHAYAKGPGPEEFPVTVKAPIISDGLTGVQPLLDFVESIKAHNNKEVAAEEANRLQPWFSAASIYLTQALKDADPESEAGQNKEKLKELIAPGKLSTAFNAMAAYTRNTLISDVTILPSNINKGPAWKLFMDNFNPSFMYGGHPFSFGFLQVYEGGDWLTASSSTTIPTFTLDAKLMEEIAPHQPAELYRRLQRVLTDMNHDTLHHFHSPYINGRIAHKFLGSNRGSWARNIVDWAKSLAGGGGRIEEWSQISHGKIYMTPENAPLVKEVGENMNRYFDELDRLGEVLPKERAHEIIDYFGTVMAQTLSRTFPFNHTLMLQCLERLEEADPLSETELKEKAIEKYCEMDDWKKGGMTLLRNSARNDVIQDIIKGYRKLGLDILPDDNSAVTFQGLKLLQLARLEPDEMRSHVPEPVYPPDQRVRKDSDRAFLDMVMAVAKTTGNKLGGGP